MIKTFKNQGSSDIAANVNSSLARRTIPAALKESARRKLMVLARATTLEDIANIPGYRLERLRGKRQGQYSIRINAQYRICFVWDGKNASDVEIVDYH